MDKYVAKINPKLVLIILCKPVKHIKPTNKNGIYITANINNDLTLYFLFEIFDITKYALNTVKNILIKHSINSYYITPSFSVSSILMSPLYEFSALFNTEVKFFS